VKEGFDPNAKTKAHGVWVSAFAGTTCGYARCITR
jgi:hypothetical protein